MKIPEYIEGPEALENFKQFASAILQAPVKKEKDRHTLGNVLDWGCSHVNSCGRTPAHGSELGWLAHKQSSALTPSLPSRREVRAHLLAFSCDVMKA